MLFKIKILRDYGGHVGEKLYIKILVISFLFRANNLHKAVS